MHCTGVGVKQLAVKSVQLPNCPEVPLSCISSLLGGKDGSVLSSGLAGVVGGQIAWLSMFCER